MNRQSQYVVFDLLLVIVCALGALVCNIRKLQR
jgi:hypothetical protein